MQAGADKCVDDAAHRPFPLVARIVLRGVVRVGVVRITVIPDGWLAAMEVPVGESERARWTFLEGIEDRVPIHQVERATRFEEVGNDAAPLVEIAQPTEDTL